MNGRRVLLRVGVLLVAMFLIGCSGGQSGPPTLPVSGTISYKGKPLDDAVVTFHPAVGAKGAAQASGKTDAQGKYKLTASAGTYAVTISKVINPEGEKSDEQMKKEMNMGTYGGDPSKVGGDASSEEAMKKAAEDASKKFFKADGGKGDEAAVKEGVGGGSATTSFGGEGEGDSFKAQMEKRMKGAAQVPTQYGDPAKSGLTAVVASGTLVFDFTLAD